MENNHFFAFRQVDFLSSLCYQASLRSNYLVWNTTSTVISTCISAPFTSIQDIYVSFNEILN